jgi:hypothetical protein
MLLLLLQPPQLLLLLGLYADVMENGAISKRYCRSLIMPSTYECLRRQTPAAI